MLIVLEGIDGVGKATQTALLLEKFRGRGVDAAVASFPDYTAHFGRVLGEYLNGKLGTLEQVHPKLSAILYLNNLRECRKRLRALLETRTVVVSDRYVPSTMAYQGGRLRMMGQPGPAEELLWWISRTAYEVFRLPQPDIVIQLDATIETSAHLVAQKRGRGYTDKKADLHEANLDFMRHVQEEYARLATDLSRRSRARRWGSVHLNHRDTGEILPIDVVADEVWNLVQQFCRDLRVLGV